MDRDSKGKFIKGNKVSKKADKVCLYPGCDMPLTRPNQKFCRASHRIMAHRLKKLFLEKKV